MRIGIVAGEASGDLLGAGLINALRRTHPHIEVEGVAGPAMRAAGCNVLESSEALAVMGLIEPIREIPRLLKLRKMLLQRWKENPPDVVVGIDAPDFNLGLELRLKRHGIPTVHYVSPSVWAWRQGRVHKIRKAVDAVLCLLPFEKQFYDDHNVPAVFVGHPMAERFAESPDSVLARAELGLADAKVIAIMPGSRRGEVERLGPVFAASCAKLLKDPARAGTRFIAPMANADLKQLFQTQLDAAGIGGDVLLVDGQSEKVLTAADVVLLASGTAALEAALLATPIVAAYRVAPVTYQITQIFNLIKTPYVTLPNLLTEEPLVPEFIQDAATPEALSAELAALLDDDARRENIVRIFSALRDQLAKGADERAACAVIAVANGEQL